MVIEGQDQFRGWFQSLLLTAAAADCEHSPFKSVMVHGFVVDEANQKMSKSLGNVVDPIDVIGGNAKAGMPVCRVDGLR